MLNMVETENFLNELVNVIKNRFPNSRVFWKRIKLYTSTYHIYFYLSNSNEEVSNGIIQNDALSWCFSIHTDNIDGYLNDDIIIDLYNSTICRIADKTNPKEKYCVYGSVKVPFRKIKGNTEVCIAKMRKFIDKTVEIMLTNAESINNGTIKGYFKVEDKIKKE